MNLKYRTNQTLKTLWFLAFLMLSDCQNTDLETHKTPKEKQFRLEESQQLNVKSDLSAQELAVLSYVFNNEHHISQQEAKEIAQEAMILFFDGNSEKTARMQSQRKEISSVDVIRLSERENRRNRRVTRSLSYKVPVDTLYYAFNFANDGGYALISADNRLPETVLGYADHGVFQVNTDNLSFMMFLDRLETYMVNKIMESEANNAIIRRSIIEKTGALTAGVQFEKQNKSARRANGWWGWNWRSKNTPQTPAIRNPQPWRISRFISPMIPVEWGQLAPFNDGVRYYNCSYGTAPTGCVATALVQLMAYWKYPKQVFHNRIQLDWDELIKYTGVYSQKRNSRYRNWAASMLNAPPYIKKSVADLMWYAGHVSHMSYGCRSSGSEMERAVRYLRECGYNVPFYPEYYKEHIVRNSLDRNRPVIMATNVYSVSNNKKIMLQHHAWIIDGYFVKERALERITYFHHNWGWDGAQNGYYIAGAFEIYDGGPYEPSNKFLRMDGYNRDFMFPDIHLNNIF